MVSLSSAFGHCVINVLFHNFTFGFFIIVCDKSDCIKFQLHLVRPDKQEVFELVVCTCNLYSVSAAV